MDEYHNRKMPETSFSEFAIIPRMVDMARIVRKVSVGIYHSSQTAAQNLAAAFKIEQELDDWILQLPAYIRPGYRSAGRLAALREPTWCQRQRLVLDIREFQAGSHEVECH